MDIISEIVRLKKQVYFLLRKVGSGGGGSSVWGSITGTLSDQTDLNSALNGKQATLVSGTNIKTINGSSVLGSGDLTVSGSGTINTGNQYRLPYYSASPTGTTLSEAGAITAARILKSDANGVPTHTAYTEDDLAYWKTLPGTPTRVGNTSFTITDTANANLYNLKFNRGTVLKWTDTTVKQAMVVSATYSSNTVTITIIGDILSGTATMSSMKWCFDKAIIKEFAIAGTLATGDDLGRIWEADKPYRVFGADAYVHTAGTTNATTFEIRKNGSANSLFTTDISIASTALRGYGYTADDNSSLALNDICSLSINTVSTTAPIDCYVALFIFPTYNQYL